MSIVAVSENVLAFWFKGKDGFRMGSPADSARNYQLLKAQNVIKDGIEISLLLSRLENTDQYPLWVYDEINNLQYKSMHLGEYKQDFLVNDKKIGKKLKIFSSAMNKFGINSVIVHAQHFYKNRSLIRELMLEFLPDIKILVENDGLGQDWAASIEGLTEIFTDCPEFGFCLDICHLKDTDTFSLEDLLMVNEISQRIKQVHVSFSPHNLGYDPYQKRGYEGYSPNHALFSLVENSMSQKTKKIISSFPVVIEGVVPKEDKNLCSLRKEIELFS